MSTVAAATFKITNTKLYVPIVTLSTKDNAKLAKLLEGRFNRPVYWNEYQTKIGARNLDNNNFIRFPLDASFQGVKRLFVLVFDNTEGGANKVERNSHTKFYYNVLIFGINFFWNQPINDIIKQYDGIRKIATRQGDDYTVC